jgi:hypothetical protein
MLPSTGLATWVAKHGCFGASRRRRRFLVFSHLFSPVFERETGGWPFSCLLCELAGPRLCQARLD